MNVKTIRCISVGFKQLLLIISIILNIYGLTAAAEKTQPEQEKKFQFAPEAEKGADQLFKDASLLAEKKPDEAIRLYQRALQFKPDAWAERKKLALLYEKLGKLDYAASEYETINGAVDSAESNADLARTLEKVGMLKPAASAALRGARKLPEDRALSIYACDLLLKAGQPDMAFELLNKYIQNRPEDKETLFLLGRINEQKGNLGSALRAYYKSMKWATGTDEYKKIFGRLERHAIRVDDLWIFSPKGWELGRNTLSNKSEDQSIYAEVHASADINAVAIKVVKEKMPQGMFETEQIKGYDEMRKMASEISKASPDASKVIITGKLPVLITKKIAGPAEGLLLLASSNEEPSEHSKSVCVLALKSGNKIYTATWISSKKYQEGEKALLSLFDNIVLPL